MELLKLSLRKLVVIVCFSTISVLTQSCYAVYTNSSANTQNTSSWLTTGTVALVSGGIIAAIILALKGGSSSSATDNQNIPSQAHAIPVIYSFSNQCWR